MVEGDPIPTIRPNMIQAQTGIEPSSETIAQLRSNVDDPGALETILSGMISRTTRVGWTTTGHTAIDVNLYAYGPGASRFTGNHDNTFVGETLADLLGFDLTTLTTDLMQRMDTGTVSTGDNR
jgi:alkaline phosphatase